jgi:hypothetical protein
MIEPTRPTTRALLGTMLLVGFLLIYVLAAMVLAAAVLPGGNRIVEFFYYAIAGLAWVPPAGIIIRWMYARPAR